ncbi:hypothetical protein A3D08_01525 [Candidatus Roizmanbacteria bacterium RIFCSPHIGHO2_02_FULL_43_11]|uniref:D-isomer specific 2-hydroxyacid dehydrogenase NAD-binding domain-containing protein n=1 Tax=Candidatus Roizmanbacteria bacterium RIFCSPHIGHO2_02_FULL_43_11 TaxID=1802043 RepID=A0A1F7HJG3_9BACT|nr:MAG: hypothetical protein A3D08_01525 [Candidatus Roizmanbacteria bacterium RIFCSPHIGHO2_02_FULL_43_11]
MKVILIAQEEEFNEKQLKRLQEYTPVQWFKDKTADILNISALSDDDEKILALSPVPMGWELPKDLYKILKNVKFINLATTTYEYLDLAWCKKNNIQVTNIPHYATNAVAEQAILLMLSLTKKLPAQIKSNYTYAFTKDVLGIDIAGKKVGIIGLGDIGTRIAEMVSSLGMDVSYWSLRSRHDNYRYKSLDTLLRESDIVFPTVESSPNTYGLLNKEKLSQLKKTAIFVSLIDERIWDKEYLIEKVEENELAGLAFEGSEKVSDYKGNVMVLPQLAWFSQESLDKNIKGWADTIISCIQDKPINLI